VPLRIKFRAKAFGIGTHHPSVRVLFKVPYLDPVNGSLKDDRRTVKPFAQTRVFSV